MYAFGAACAAIATSGCGGAPAAPTVRVPPARGVPELPPRSALVLGERAGKYALGLALQPVGRRTRLIATVVSPSDIGVEGLAVAFRVGPTRVRANPCGSGCYRADVPKARLTSAVTVSLPGRSVRFAIPPDPLPAADLLRRATARYRALRSVSYRERLSSGRSVVTSVWKAVAPDRFEYKIPGGSEGVVIGATRWDRSSPQAPWVRSSIQRFRVPAPIWTARASNVRLLSRTPAGSTVAFLDRSLPAWFTVRFDRRLLPVSLEMTAAAHFMHHDYLSFNRPLKVRAPGASR